MYRPARRPPGLPTLLLCALGLFLWRLTVIPQLGISLYVDEAQYWTWAQAPDWGYFSKPPGIAGLVWLSTALFGNGILGVKALAMLCYPAAGLVCWAIARRLFDAWTAFWAGLVVLTLPIFSWLGLFVSTDALLTLFWVLALWAYLEARDRDRWRDWLLLGLIGGLGLMSKYTMAACLGAIFLHLLAFHRPLLASPRPWAAAALALLMLAPNLAWNVAHDFPTLKHTADITLHKAAGGAGALGEFWGAQWIAFGPLCALLLPLAVIGGGGRLWRDERYRLLLWVALPLWAVVSLQALKGGANANWAAPAFAPTAIALVAGLRASGRTGWLKAAFILNLLLVTLTYYWPTLVAVSGQASLAQRSPFARTMAWDALGREVAPLIAAHPGLPIVADNRTLLAHLSYELREQAPRVISWNPQQEMGDYYKMTSDLRPWQGKDVLFVSEDDTGPEIGRHFARFTPLADIHLPITPTRERRLKVYLGENFRGY